METPIPMPRIAVWRRSAPRETAVSARSSAFQKASPEDARSAAIRERPSARREQQSIVSIEIDAEEERGPREPLAGFPGGK
jgi:hypothetical protein